MKTDKSTVEFEWDKGNIDKNKKHKVEDRKVEEVFFDDRKVVLKDTLHSGFEKRFIILGLTKKARLLYIVFTIRKERIRIISARNAIKREVHLYEKTT